MYLSLFRTKVQLAIIIQTKKVTLGPSDLTTFAQANQYCLTKANINLNHTRSNGAQTCV